MSRFRESAPSEIFKALIPTILLVLARDSQAHAKSPDPPKRPEPARLWWRRSPQVLGGECLGATVQAFGDAGLLDGPRLVPRRRRRGAPLLSGGKAVHPIPMD